MRSIDMPVPSVKLTPPSPEAIGRWKGLCAKLVKHRDKITAVFLGQLLTVLGLAVGLRVLTEFASPAALGEYKLAIGIVGLFSGLFFRPFTQFVMRHYHDVAGHHEGRAFLAFGWRVIQFASLTLGVGLAITLFWYGRTTLGLGWVAAAIGISLLYLHVALSFQHGVLTTQNRQKSAILIRTTMQCATPLAVAAGAYFLGQSGEYLLLAEFLLLGLIFGFSYWWLRERSPIAKNEITKERQREWSKDAARFVTPLLGVSFFSWLLGVSDRFILAAYHLPHDVGLYTAVYALGSQPMMMVTGMTAQLVYPLLFKAAAQKRADTQLQVLRYVVSTAAIAGALGMGALFICGQQIIELLLAETYRVNALPLLLWVAAGYSLLGVATTFELKAYAGKRTAVIGIAYALAAVVNLVLNLLWIPADGALGAARATFFGFLAYLFSIAILSLNPLRPAEKTQYLKMTKIFKRLTISFFWIVMGRKRLVRFARMLTHAARLDGANQMLTNGEMLVIDTALKQAASTMAPPVIIDCGANIGHYTIEVGQRAAALGLPAIALHAFEPASATLCTLRKNLATELQSVAVVINQAALSDTSGQLELHIVHDNAGVNSLLLGDFSRAAYTEKVSVGTLDDYCAKSSISRILLLKIDTEGNDFNVLLGSSELLKRGAIELVQFEYNYRWIYARKYLRDVFELARTTGMHLGKVTPGGIEFYPEWHPELESYTDGNYLLCRAAWVERFPKVEWWGQNVVKKIATRQ